VGRSYAEDLRTQYWDVRRFVSRNGGDPGCLRRSPKLANEWLIRYVQAVHDSPLGTLKDARYGILGVQHVHRGMRGKLRAAWDSISSWQLGTSGKHRVPIPEDVLEALSNLAFLMGLIYDVAQAQYWLPLGILLRAGFYGMMRPGELYALTSDGVAHASGRVRKTRHGAILTIRDPKNRRAMGRQQFCLIDDELTCRWLAWVTEDLPSGVKIFPGTGQKARSLLAHLLDLLQLGRVGFSLGSLRAGGATARYVADRNIPALRFQGRWRGDRSLEPYLQEAMCEMVAAELGPSEDLVDGLRRLTPTLATPPHQPWFEYFTRRRQLTALLRHRTQMAELATRWHREFGIPHPAPRLKFPL
jgi:hypothetical protein